MRAGEGWDFPLVLEWVGFGWEQAVDPLEQNEEWAREKPDLGMGRQGRSRCSSDVLVVAAQL